MAMPRGTWKPRKRVLLENPGVVREISSIQKALSEYRDAPVTLEEVVDYLLQSYYHANERESSMEFQGFIPRLRKVFADE